MSRDYKHMGGRKAGKPGIGTTSFLAFLSGLSIGLLVAFFVYLYQYQARSGLRLEAEPEAAPAIAKESAKTGGQTTVPKPTFDFYKILPSREVNVSEWIAEEPPAEAAPAAVPGGGGETGALYILQVGSYKTPEAADQAKARLALLGIESDIQRVVINGQDAVHRVRIGPYQSPEKFEEVRRRLRANQIDFMVLQLKVDEAQTGGG